MTRAELNNSTIVRTKNLGLEATRAGLRVLSPRAPSLAARWAERLFLTARRHERPSWEHEALRSAKRGRVAHAGGWLPTWTWRPEGSRGGWLSETRTVILVHGWEGRGSQLARFAPPLVAAGFRVVTFDAPGHGDSTLSRASLVDHARALRAVARAVGPVHAVIGHSVGGAAALFATRFGLAADRFALIAPPSTPAAFASHFARVLGIDDAVKDAMITRLESRFRMPMSSIDARIDAERLRVPLFVVHDLDDETVRFASGHELAELAPEGRILATSGLGHRAILKSAEVVDAVTRFVSEGVPAPSFAATLDGELFMRDTRW